MSDVILDAQKAKDIPEAPVAESVPQQTLASLSPAQTAFFALQKVMACRPHDPDISIFNKMHDGLDYILRLIQEAFKSELAAAQAALGSAPVPAAPEAVAPSDDIGQAVLD
jgi:hypothetical protein